MNNPLARCATCSHPRRQHRPVCACGCNAMQPRPAPANSAPKHAKPKAEPKPACPECGRKRGHKMDCARG